MCVLTIKCMRVRERKTERVRQTEERETKRQREREGITIYTTLQLKVPQYPSDNRKISSRRQQKSKACNKCE